MRFAVQSYDDKPKNYETYADEHKLVVFAGKRESRFAHYINRVRPKTYLNTYLRLARYLVLTELRPQ